MLNFFVLLLIVLFCVFTGHLNAQELPALANEAEIDSAKNNNKFDEPYHYSVDHLSIIKINIFTLSILYIERGLRCKKIGKSLIASRPKKYPSQSIAAY